MRRHVHLHARFTLGGAQACVLLGRHLLQAASEAKQLRRSVVPESSAKCPNRPPWMRVRPRSQPTPVPPLVPIMGVSLNEKRLRSTRFSGGTSLSRSSVGTGLGRRPVVTCSTIRVWFVLRVEVGAWARVDGAGACALFFNPPHGGPLGCVFPPDPLRPTDVFS